MRSNVPRSADVDVGDTADMMRAAVRSGSVAMLVGIAVACASPPAPSRRPSRRGPVTTS